MNNPLFQRSDPDPIRRITRVKATKKVLQNKRTGAFKIVDLYSTLFRYGGSDWESVTWSEYYQSKQSLRK